MFLIPRVSVHTTWIICQFHDIGWLLKHTHKSGFKKSDLMINRIIRREDLTAHIIVLKFMWPWNPTVTVQTGLITSFIATLDLIFFLASVSIYSVWKQRVALIGFCLQPTGLYVFLIPIAPRKKKITKPSFQPSHVQLSSLQIVQQFSHE